MDYVPGQKVDVIVVQLDARVADSLATQLIQLGILDPLNTLRNGRFIQVQLQFLHKNRKVLGGKGNNVLRKIIINIVKLFTSN